MIAKSTERESMKLGYKGTVEADRKSDYVLMV